MIHLINFMCVVCVYACIYVYMHGIREVQKTMSGPLVLELMESCKPPHGYWELNLGPLGEQSVCLTTELAFQCPLTTHPVCFAIP